MLPIVVLSTLVHGHSQGAAVLMKSTGFDIAEEEDGIGFKEQERAMPCHRSILLTAKGNIVWCLDI